MVAGAGSALDPGVGVHRWVHRWLLQASGRSAVADLPRPALAAGVFVLTVLFGGAVVYRYGDGLDRAVEASAERPLMSLLYGAAAFGAGVFAVGFVFSKLGRFGVGGATLQAAGAVVFGAVLLALAGAGFAVVGAWAAGRFGEGDPWPGLVGTALVGALAWLVLPVAAGALVWALLAAAGLGGPTRRWVHASKDVDEEKRRQRADENR